MNEWKYDGQSYFLGKLLYIIFATLYRCTLYPENFLIFKISISLLPVFCFKESFLMTSTEMEISILPKNAYQNTIILKIESKSNIEKNGELSYVLISDEWWNIMQPLKIMFIKNFWGHENDKHFLQWKCVSFTDKVKYKIFSSVWL